MFFRTLTLAATLSFALCSTARAERTKTDSATWWWLTDVSVATVAAHISANNSRVIDIDISESSPLTVNAILVENSGSYQQTSWLYDGKTAAEVTTLLTQHDARPLAIEPYRDGSGKFIVVMVDNSGTNKKTWWWHHGKDGITAIYSSMTLDSARPTDIDVYPVSSEQHWSAVMLKREGSDDIGFGWGVHNNTALIKTEAANKTQRVLDVERFVNGAQQTKFVAILVDNTAAKKTWFHIDRTKSDVEGLISSYGARLIDVESYDTANGKRYAVVLLDNTGGTYASASTSSDGGPGATDAGIDSAALDSGSSDSQTTSDLSSSVDGATNADDSSVNGGQTGEKKSGCNISAQPAPLLPLLLLLVFRPLWRVRKSALASSQEGRT